MKIPILNKGRVIAHARVDERDYEALSYYRWFICNGYAVRYENQKPKFPKVLMHRQVLGILTDPNKRADHINRDILDNRRGNLRAITPAENPQNCKVYKNSKSGIRGVYLNRGRWCAQVIRNHKKVFQKNCSSLEEARDLVSMKRAELLPFATD